MTKKHCGKLMVAVEYSYGSAHRYDGISEFLCRECGYREGRWSGKELKEGELEPPFGGKRYITHEARHYNL